MNVMTGVVTGVRALEGEIMEGEPVLMATPQVQCTGEAGPVLIMAEPEVQFMADTMDHLLSTTEVRTMIVTQGEELSTSLATSKFKKTNNVSMGKKW